MVAFKMLASVIFASIFLTAVGAIYVNYGRGAELSDFERDAEELAGRIGALAKKDVGTIEFFEINVPAGCELRFQDNQVLALVEGQQKAHDAGITITGPEFVAGRITLRVERVSGGVEVNAA